jgi:hypothetical protein
MEGLGAMRAHDPALAERTIHTGGALTPAPR